MATRTMPFLRAPLYRVDQLQDKRMPTDLQESIHFPIVETVRTQLITVYAEPLMQESLQKSSPLTWEPQ
ncbi:hypothetical protein SLS58_003877 [Diplodia intermedia]|uniref:Uncharacterized protein n=1 Tax=Diplodia intermedia TaxID=856260 RepID=A0ABR3TUX3_9PEZI